MFNEIIGCEMFRNILILKINLRSTLCFNLYLQDIIYVICMYYKKPYFSIQILVSFQNHQIS